MNAPVRLLRTTLLTAALIGLASSALAQPYPRLGLYGSVMGNGYPFYDSNVGGALDPAVLDEVARYHEVVLDASPLTEYRPDCLLALRQRRPGIHLLAYVLGHDIWAAANADSTVHFPTRYRRLVRDLGGFLYDTHGNEYPGANVNLAKRDANGNFVVAQGLAQLFEDAIVSTGEWDGLFVDVYCSTLGWSQTPSESIDVRRAGYPNIASFDAAWGAATDTLADRLRRLAGPTQILVGNCAQGTHYASFNGWMRENFPFQDGGTWYDNLLQDPGGYFADDQHFRAPPHNYIFSAVNGANAPYVSTNTRKERFGLGSAALGEGLGVFGPSDRIATTAPYHSWWYDEYAVDLATGHSSTRLIDTGWLGLPLGPARQMIWIGSNPDAVSNSDFETDVTSGWNFWHNTVPGATLAQDLTTAGKGAASAHISIPTAAALDWQITFSSTNGIGLFSNQASSATFWARASAPRSLPVVAASPGGGALAQRTITIGTGWQQYQVVLVPVYSGTALLQFYLGASAGEVWFDDVHFQVGVTNLYRRDFQNGIVLVNPADQIMSVPLGRTYRRLYGIQDLAVNDGSIVTQVAIPPSDALFLLGDDTLAPSAVTDLHATP